MYLKNYMHLLYNLQKKIQIFICMKKLFLDKKICNPFQK
jgi:hypothetical protein